MHSYQEFNNFQVELMLLQSEKVLGNIIRVFFKSYYYTREQVI